ncbi:MAG: protein-export chaperone SecB [Gammaproteobacteria bacterium]
MADNEQKFEIQKIFLKDASFESPNSPDIFREKWQPKTDIHLTAQNAKLTDELYEVTLNVEVTSTQNEKTAFMVELKQSGVFRIKDFPEDQRNHLLGSYCPHTLFPFAREVVADLIGKGGFPPLLLSPVNFDALYSQQLEKLKEQQQTTSEETKH